MIEDSFYVTLPSNVNVDETEMSKDEERNSMTSWTTQLRQWIHLEGVYEVGLAEFSYTYSWFNITKKQEIMLCEIDGSCLEYDVQYLEPGVHTDIHRLVKIIQEKIDTIKIGFEEVEWNRKYSTEIDESGSIETIKIAYEDIAWKRKPLIKVDESGSRVQVLPGEVSGGTGIPAGTLLYPKFSDDLSQLLGLPTFSPRGKFDAFNYKKIFNDDLNITNVFKDDSEFHPFDLRAGIHSLFVYTDIIKHRYVGNTMAQLLRKVEVPNAAKFGDQINITFERPHYHPIASPSLSTIQLTIRDDTDTPIPFTFGRCFAVLHFRRVNRGYDE